MILKYPHRTLQSRAREVTDSATVDLAVRHLQAAIASVTWGQPAGMAAPQVGLPYRIFIAEGKVYVNPIIIEKSSSTRVDKEGCYSLDQDKFDYPVRRNTAITLSWVDERWHEHTQTFRGMTARVIQHEYDHLEGILCSD